jgi:glycosyltransferase involved in cell wall biosynthesis
MYQMNNDTKNNIIDIALICPTLAGGLGAVTITLAETMRKRGVSAEIWVLYKNQKIDLGTSVPVRPISNTRASLSLFKLVRMLKTHQPKRILSASFHLNCMVIFAKIISKIKTYLVIAEHTSLSNALEAISLPKRVIAKVAIPALYRFSDAFVAVSNDAARQMEIHARLTYNSVITIYNPIINDELFCASKKKFSHPFFKINEHLFLSVGRISKEKDYPTLIAAFAKANQTKASRLIIAGDGPEMGMLKKQIAELDLSDRVALLGHIPNPKPLYTYADIFVLSSKREGLPTVLVEALALGCKVISTDARSGPREILKGGAYGKLVPIMDVDALATAMIESIHSKESNTVPHEALLQYDVNLAVDRYVKVLDI